MLATNKCIVSLATKNSRYVDGLARLSNSLRDNADRIDFLGFIHEHSVDAPLHTESNYGFKVYAIQKAIDLGYEQILWLDASVWAVAPVRPIFDIIEQQGYWFEGNRCWLGEWCNDKTLKFYDIEREEALKIPMLQSGFMGFNTKLGYDIWHLFTQGFNEGLFNGAWTNANKTESLDERVLGFRHDQSVLSCILHYLNLPYSLVAEYVQYAGEFDKVLNNKIIFKCQGI
jgi:hypothetical protein